MRIISQMEKKIISVLITILLIISISPVMTGEDVLSRATIYVDDNAIDSWYDATHVKTIQEGINNASTGDTVYVFNGTYFENIIIDKTLTLIGENKINTIINGNGYGNVLSVNENNTIIKSFTIKNAGNPPSSYSGILINSNNNQITNNIITNNQVYGINILSVSTNTIENNTIKNNGEGIRLYSSTMNTILNNSIKNNYFGIRNWYGFQNNISNNDISSNNNYGIFFKQCFHDTIINNSISDSSYGIRLWNGSQVIITGNHIIENSIGLYLDIDSTNHTIYNNYFSNTNNTQNYGYHNRWNVTLTAGSNIIAGPYIGGNYWDDYTGYDNDADGIGDTNIPFGPGDYLPLVLINHAPIANFTYNPINPTTVDVIEFNDTSSDADGTSDIINWTWDFGDGSMSYQQNTTYSYSDDGNYTITLLIRDLKGSLDSIQKNITIENVPPAATFQYTPINPITSDMVLFNSTSIDHDGEIVNWSWDFNDGNYSYGENTSHSFDIGTYNVVLYVTDDDGSLNMTNKTITVVNILPEVDFSFIPFNPTTADNIQFTDLSSDRSGRSIQNWTWDFDDGNSSYEQHPTHQYIDNGNYTVTLTITDNDDATNSTTKTVPVSNLPPEANFSFYPTNPTAADSISFNDTSTDPDGTIINWTWDFGDGNTSSTQNTTHSYADNGTYLVTLTVMDDDTSYDTITKQISISNIEPVANFTFSPSNPDTSQTIMFNDTSTDPDGSIVSWFWDFGDGNTSLTQNTTHSYADNGSFLVTLQIQDNDGAIDSTSEIITISNLGPIAQFSFVPLSPSSDQIIEFTDESTDSDGTIVNWTWDFDDGTIGYEQNPNHQYTNNGLYNVTLLVTDDDGRNDTYWTVINVTNADPVSIFTWTPVNPTTQDTINFIDLSSDYDGIIVSWYWDFGDGNFSSAQYPSHQYGDNGEYNVSLTVSDNQGAVDVDVQTLIVLNIGPVANFTIFSDNVSTFDLISFTDTSTDIDGIIVNWTWDFDDGTISYDQHPTHQYADDGIYSINLTVTDNDGNKSSIQKQVMVNNREPIVNFSYSPSNPTTESMINFTDLSIDSDGSIVSWYWDFDDSYYTSTQHPTHQYSNDGTYNVTLTVEDDDGFSNATTLQINVSNLAPTASFTYSPLFPTVADFISFVDNSMDSDGTIVNWTWDFDDGNISYMQHPTHSYSLPGNYTVNLTVRDDDSATHSATVIVTVEPMPSCFDEIWVDDDYNSSLWGWQVTYFDTIQDGVNAVCSGGTVHIAEGSYHERINLLGKSITLNGSGISTIINVSTYNGYGIYNFGDNVSLKKFSLVGNSSAVSTGYGIKISGASDISLQEISVKNTGRSGIDLNGVNYANITNVQITDSVYGFGIMMLDSNNIQLSNINTSGNAWGGVTIQSSGAYYPGGCNNISFTGSFNANETNPFMIEKDPPFYYDITNISSPNTFDYIVYGYRTGDEYKQWFYQEELNQAKNFTLSIINSPVFNYNNILIHDIPKENYFIIPGMTIQDTIDDATNCDTIYVDSGNYTESFYIVGKSLSLIAPDGATLICPSSPHDVTIAESPSEIYEYGIGLFGGTYNPSNDTVWGNSTISVKLQGFTIDANNHDPSDRWSSILCRNINTAECDGISEINNNTLKNIYVDGDETFGIIAYGNMNINIKDNNINQFGRGGIGIYDGVAEIKNNKVIGESNTTWATNGIQIAYGASGIIENNEVSNCGWPGENWSGTAIIVGDTSNVSIINNYIHDSETAINIGDFPSIWGAPFDERTASNIIVSNNLINHNEWGINVFNNISDVVIEGNEINNTVYDAIDVYNYGYGDDSPTNIIINFNSITKVGVDGLWVGPLVTDMVDATCNWWNDATGPYNASINPDGLGCNISGNASFIPWLTSYPGGDCDGYPNETSEIDINQSISDRPFLIRHASDGDWGGAQNFTPTLGTISKAEVYLKILGTPVFNLTIEIREDSIDGLLLDTFIFSPSNFTSEWTWVTLDFDDISVTPDTDYFIIMPPPPTGVNTTFGYAWGYSLGDTYDDGSLWFTRTSGSFWLDLPSLYDFTFRTYGY